MPGIYRFINTTVPTKGCNLRCEYCYIRQWGEEEQLQIRDDDKWYKYPIHHMIKALTAERMGGVCMFNFSAVGETLLSPLLYEIVTGLIKNGHYVAIISNCTITSEILKYTILDKETKDHLFFKCSFHYRELKKRGLLEVYSKNIAKLKENEISFSVEMVSNDFIIDEIDEVKNFCIKEFGALPHVLGGREETIKGKYPKYETKLKNEEFHEIWGAFKSPLFEYQDKDYIRSYNDDFCYAGVYTGSLDMRSGDFSACPGNRIITNLFDDIDSKIQFLPVGYNCPFPFCFCGFFLQVLAGVCSDSHKIDYRFYEFRDRECKDGSHWLTPSIKEVFSHTCAEFHKKIDEKQMYIINTFLKTVYCGYDKNIEQRMIDIVERFFKTKNVGNVAIYGMSSLGIMFNDIASKAGLPVVCGVDKKYKEISCTIPVVSPEEIPDYINTLIITSYSQFPSISKYIKDKKPNVTIYSILDLIEDKM